MINLEHIGICAKDTNQLKDWYIKMFNFKVVYDNKKEMPIYFLLLEDNSMIEIYPMEFSSEVYTNKKQGIRHIALGTDNINEQYENLIRNHVTITDDLKENPNGVKTVFFRDIEGNNLHFIQRPKSLY